MAVRCYAARSIFGPLAAFRFDRNVYINVGPIGRWPVALRILVPADDSPAAPLALNYAFGLADRLNGTLYVTGMSEEENDEPIVFVSPLNEQELTATTSEYGHNLDVSVRTPDMGMGPVPIRMFVADAAIDVVVIPTHERKAVVRAVRGTLDDHVVRQLNVPVILLHPYRPGTLTHLELEHALIPLDGTPDSERALDAVLLLDPDRRIRYTLVQVLVAPAPDTFPAIVAAEITQGELKHDLREATDYLESVARRLRARGSRVETAVLIRDDPGRALLQEIEALKVDLIAMTTHARGGWRHHVGGLPAKLLHHTSTPVMLVNVSAREPGASDRVSLQAA